MCRYRAGTSAKLIGCQECFGGLGRERPKFGPISKDPGCGFDKTDAYDPADDPEKHGNISLDKEKKGTMRLDVKAAHRPQGEYNDHSTLFLSAAVSRSLVKRE